MPAPHDDDDITAPARPTGKRSAPLPPAPGAKPAAVAWGLVGSLHRIEPLSVLPGQTGLVRLVPNTIKYTKPPLDVTWSEVKAEPGRFEMVWPGDPTAARSLERVCEDLHKLRFAEGVIRSDHAWCKELDEAVFSLLTTADKLERKGWDVGLLTPTGVIMHRTAEGVEAVPVDLGFTWTGEFGDPPWEHSPGRPPWLSPDPAENPAALAWDRTPVEQQFAAPGGSPFPPAAPGANVRTLARVIAWALIGKPAREIAEGPTWNALSVLRAAHDGAVNTPGELLAELQATPPSTYFAEEAPTVHLTPPGSDYRQRNTKALVVLGALILLVAASALSIQCGLPPSPFATNPTDSKPSAGDFQKALDDYNRLPPGDLAGRLGQFPKVAAAGAGNPNNDRFVGQVRFRLFADWVTACETEVAAGADAAKRGEAGHNLRRLADGYAAILKDHPTADPAHRDKEQQWLDQYDRLADSLGWPR